ncbi:exodeoxyribonuclease VII large subunit [Actibacterium sp. 188UL27-1]|uniref:exodeoxyribonuclease VII large subunit n=1 Tax=Actibacterium sp. 188UL27-1 TaxID=2786961 RepID=UPI001956025A|nr:exodeoxyribonuclease VII large subunit [Actibacterium sp. 188UL27-1]MBM7066150.1 exodeoxyribonuclease VII large subunit [Actibacterium sp. 188UL27-1]
MDLLDDESSAGASNAPEFSVSELSGAIKRTLEGAFGRVRVRGEVGRVMKAKSGHMYYDIKDDRNVIACTTWKGQVSGLGVLPEEGLEVIVTGKLSSFSAQSRYNINVDTIEVAGAGALMAMLEKRKAQLAADGLFAPERKQALPFLPEVIGVVTSPSGAVIRDILHRLRDRFPRKVLIWPVAVQGANCAPEVTAAIAGFNQFTPGGALPRPDLLIVARGGGSIEDLWGFNEESVVRAAAASDIPLISAVGHETDTTLIDFASDKRAPTPTAAAEMAVPVRLDLMAWVDGQEARLSRALAQGIGQRQQHLRDLSRALPRPETLLNTAAQRLDLWADRLPNALRAGIQSRQVRLAQAGLRANMLRNLLTTGQERLTTLDRRRPAALTRQVNTARRHLTATTGRLRLSLLQQDVARKSEAYGQLSRRFTDLARAQLQGRRNRLDTLDRLRETLGYQATLARGYAVVRAGDQVITTKAAAAKAGSLEIEFQDGRLTPQMEAKAAKSRKKPDTPPPDQGTLF